MKIAGIKVGWVAASSGGGFKIRSLASLTTLNTFWLILTYLAAPISCVTGIDAKLAPGVKTWTIPTLSMYCIGNIHSTIFLSYSESTGTIGVQSMPLAVVPSMVAPQTWTGPLLSRNPVRCNQEGQTCQGMALLKSQICLALSSSRNLCSRKWCLNNPVGTTAEFKQYFDNLLVFTPSSRQQRCPNSCTTVIPWYTLNWK